MSLTLSAMMLLALILVCGWLVFAGRELERAGEPENAASIMADTDWHQYAEHSSAIERVERANLGPIVKGD